MLNKLCSFAICFFCVCFYVQSANNITTVSEKDGNVKLSNGIVELTFSATKSYDLKSIKLGGDHVLSSAGMNITPWILTYKGTKGENPTLFPYNGTYEGYKIRKDSAGMTLVFTWQMVLLYNPTSPVRMSVSLPDNSELAYWNIEADVPESWAVTKSEFPRIVLTRPDEGKIITSAGWGAEFDLKTQTYSARYPSCTGAMQLLLMHNKQGAFYFATEDRNASGKYFKAISGEKAVTFIVETVTSEAWSNRDKFSLPWATVIGYTPDGWQAAAVKWYRPFTFTTEWGNKSLQSRNIPQWLYNTDVWIRAKNVNDTIFDAVKKSLKMYGIDLGVHWYYWHHYAYDTHYPDYFPAKDSFAYMIKETQKMGGHVTPYINGRLWDPAADSYDAVNGKAASARKADGTLYTEVYGSKVLNTVTCPASDIWQKIQLSLVDRIQNELGTDGVYIDQVAAAAPEPCWAENHGHAPGGGDFWHYAYRKLLKEMRANHLKKGNIFTSEENAECYIDLFDMLLTVNTPHVGCKIVPLFPTVYSDRVITSAYTYTPIDDLTTGAFRYENMQCLLWGSQLGWVEPIPLMKEESKTEAEFLKKMMLFRRDQHDVFYGGRFIKEIIPIGDNPKKVIPGFETTPVVHASEWITKEGKNIIIVVNMDEKKHIVSLPTNNKTFEIEGLSCLRINI